MDSTLALLQNADPADPAPDSPEMVQLEGKNFNADLNQLALSVTTAAATQLHSFCSTISLLSEYLNRCL